METAERKPNRAAEVSRLGRQINLGRFGNKLRERTGAEDTKKRRYALISSNDTQPNLQASRAREFFHTPNLRTLGDFHLDPIPHILAADSLFTGFCLTIFRHKTG